MNAIGRIPTDTDGASASGIGDARRARRMRQLHELIELGMTLAHALAGQALAEVAAAGTPDRAAHGPATDASQRQTGAAAAEPAREAGDGRDGAAGTAGAGRRWADPSLGFARVSRAVCQAITLEARLAAGEIGALPRRPGATARDLGLSMIRQVLRTAAEAETDTEERVALFADIRERLNALAADEASEPPAAEIIVAVCDDLGLALDPDKLPAEIFYVLRNEAPRMLAGSGGPDPP